MSRPVGWVRPEYLDVMQQADRFAKPVGVDVDVHAVQVVEARFRPVRAGIPGGAIEGRALRLAADALAGAAQVRKLDEDGDALRISAGLEIQQVASQLAADELRPGPAHR